MKCYRQIVVALCWVAVLGLAVFLYKARVMIDRRLMGPDFTVDTEPVRVGVPDNLPTCSSETIDTSTRTADVHVYPRSALRSGKFFKTCKQDIINVH